MNLLGLDIGGAHIKASHSNGKSIELPFALWQTPDALPDALRALIGRFEPADEFLVTMTGELCDCYDNKLQGVTHIVDCMETAAAGLPTRYWSTAGGWLTAEQTKQQHLQVAASNWHALATAVGRLFSEGSTLLIDTGSTTTDIIPINDGKPVPTGLTDPGRLATGELVYLGMQRTALMALGPTIDFQEKTYHVMAEYFATTADVYVLTDELCERPDDCETADGKPLTKAHCARRIARMIGADDLMLNESDLRELAEAFGKVAIGRLVTAMRQVTSNQPVDHVVISGSGAKLAKAAAQRAFPGQQLTVLRDVIGDEAATGACAWALLQLADLS